VPGGTIERLTHEIHIREESCAAVAKAVRNAAYGVIPRPQQISGAVSTRVSLHHSSLDACLVSLRPSSRRENLAKLPARRQPPTLRRAREQDAGLQIPLASISPIPLALLRGSYTPIPPSSSGGLDAKNPGAGVLEAPGHLGRRSRAYYVMRWDKRARSYLPYRGPCSEMAASGDLSGGGDRAAFAAAVGAAPKLSRSREGSERPVPNVWQLIAGRLRMALVWRS